ncbi:hypothetical protein BDZ85DRAFT_267712 [Elsinoe ampelina]|uniref:Uncharacterized protein n=1 Tax=Elsinoe ampelina TaxID=302913 RepID=A0A6A6G286_9PEZI|nr:hypothetical protein BDZ85DRAFT_267712 [Elsinoe ampelina]
MLVQWSLLLPFAYAQVPSATDLGDGPPSMSNISTSSVSNSVNNTSLQEDVSPICYCHHDWMPQILAWDRPETDTFTAATVTNVYNEAGVQIWHTLSLVEPFWSGYDTYLNETDTVTTPITTASDGRKIAEYSHQGTIVTLTFPEERYFSSTAFQYQKVTTIWSGNVPSCSWYQAMTLTLPSTPSRTLSTPYAYIRPEYNDPLGHEYNLVMRPWGGTDEVNNPPRFLWPDNEVFSSCEWYPVGDDRPPTDTVGGPQTLTTARLLTVTSNFIAKGSLTIPVLDPDPTIFDLALGPVPSGPRPSDTGIQARPGPAIVTGPTRTALPVGGTADALVSSSTHVGGGKIPPTFTENDGLSIGSALGDIHDDTQPISPSHITGAKADSDLNASPSRSLPQSLVIGSATYSVSVVDQVLGPRGTPMTIGKTVYVGTGDHVTSVILTTNAIGAKVLIADGTSTAVLPTSTEMISFGGETYSMKSSPILIGPNGQVLKMGETLYAGSGAGRTTMVLTSDVLGQAVVVVKDIRGTSTVRLASPTLSGVTGAIVRGIDGVLEGATGTRISSGLKSKASATENRPAPFIGDGVRAIRFGMSINALCVAGLIIVLIAL